MWGALSSPPNCLPAKGGETKTLSGQREEEALLGGGAGSSSEQLLEGHQELGRAARAAGERGGKNQAVANHPSSRPLFGERGPRRTCLCTEGGRGITPGEERVWWAGVEGDPYFTVYFPTLERLMDARMSSPITCGMNVTINGEIQVKCWV